VRVWGLDKAGLGFRWFQTGNSNRRSGVYFQSSLSAGRPILPCNDLDYTEIVPTIYREGGNGCDFKDSKKPEALLRFLIEICTQPGDTILDPFGGSGTTLAVAEKMNRHSVIIENHPAALEVIQRRISNLKSGLDLDGIVYPLEVAHGITSFSRFAHSTYTKPVEIQAAPAMQKPISSRKKKDVSLFSK
jgi:adenine-specific DNA-methyltransferase